MKHTKIKKQVHTGRVKIVRIDAKTWIEVPVTVPDDEARQRYVDRLEENRIKFETRIYK